jgi:hypothetical protein
MAITASRQSRNCGSGERSAAQGGCSPERNRGSGAAEISDDPAVSPPDSNNMTLISG